MESNFIRKWYKKWTKSLLIWSKIFLVYSNLIAILHIVVGITFLLIPENSCVINGVPTVCDPTFTVNLSIIIFLICLFFLVSVYDGVFNSNLYELYSAMFFTVVIAVYAIYRFAEPYENHWPDYIFFSSSLFSIVFYLCIGYKLYREFIVWGLSKKIGLDREIRAMYKRYLIWLSFLKIDLAFTLLSAIISGKGVYNTGWRAGIDWTLVVLAIVFALLAYFAFRREIKILAWLFFIYYPLSIAYLIANWVLFAQDFELLTYVERNLGYMFCVIGGVAVIIHIVFLLLSINSYLSFGKGLKTLLPQHQKLQREEEDDDEDTKDYTHFPETVSEKDDNFTIQDVIRNTHAMANGYVAPTEDKP